MSDPIIGSDPNAERIYEHSFSEHSEADGTVGSEGGARSGGRGSHIASDAPRQVFMAQPIFSLTRLVHWMRIRKNT